MGVFAILTVLGIRYYFRHADSSAKLQKKEIILIRKYN